MPRKGANKKRPGREGPLQASSVQGKGKVILQPGILQQGPSSSKKVVPGENVSYGGIRIMDVPRVHRDHATPVSSKQESSYGHQGNVLQSSTHQKDQGQAADPSLSSGSPSVSLPNPGEDTTDMEEEGVDESHGDGGV